MTNKLTYKKFKQKTLFPVGDSNLQNSTVDLDRNYKQQNSGKLIFAHNFSLKFPLSINCRIPFSKNYFKQITLRTHKQYLYKLSNAFIRQTNKSLIVFPVMEKAYAAPGNSYRLKSFLSEKAIGVVRGLQEQYSGLRLQAPVSWLPSTQEYAVKDGVAKEMPFTFENEFAKVDKSVHGPDETGFHASGGEFDWKTPEFIDAYIRMPMTIKNMSNEFTTATKKYVANMNLHLQTLQEIRIALRPQRSRGPRFPTSFKKSATKKGVW